MNSTDSTQATLPDLDHFCMSDFEHVYEPAEDTFLLCDAIEHDRRYIVDELSPAIVLEVGCGSGCVITFLSSMLKEEGCSTLCLATDINPHAINATQRTALANKVSQDNNDYQRVLLVVCAIFNTVFFLHCTYQVYVDAIRTNLVDGISERLQQKVDVLLFNPPYVPTPSEEIGKYSMSILKICSVLLYPALPCSTLLCSALL